MKIQTRIIGAAMVVVAVVNIISTAYYIDKERNSARGQLDAAMESNDKLLQVVTAGPLYDGNVEQLDTILDSLFADPNISGMELHEYNGNIRMYRTRTPSSGAGEQIIRRVVIRRGIDQLGEITTTYTTSLIEKRLRISRNDILIFTTILALVLSLVIYYVAKGLTRPIERLTEAARDMADGHLDREIAPTGAEELRSLGRSFVRMRDAIREKMADLASQNTALQLKDRAMASSTNGIAIADPNGLLTYVNPSFLRMWGYVNASEALGRQAVDFWEDPPRAAGIIEALRLRGSFTGEMTAKRKEGTVFPVELSASLMTDERGEPSHLMASFIDITERKAAEDALRESEDRFRSIFNGVMDGIVLADIARGTFVIGNRKICEMLGCTEEELRTLRPDDIHPAEALSRVRKHLEDTTRGVISVTQEMPVKRRDGSVFYADISASVLTLGGRPHFIGIFRDITERKRAERQKELLEAQLLQAQKMESVGRLAGGVAHDFNNMLSVILGYTALMKGKLPGADPLAQYLREIEGAAIRSRDLTSQLLAFSRKQVIVPRVVNLNDLAAATQNALTRMIGEDVRLHFNPAEGLWNINIDPQQVDQIIMNLAVNARDAMPHGGALTIETANAEIDEAYCRRHAGFLPGSYVALTVSDTGIGMDKDILSQLFEPFFTTKEFGKGTGLGLATVYGIVRQNNGFITVDSDVGRGTTFKIFLPRASGEKTAADQPSPAASPLAPGVGVILLVEDDAMVRDLTTQLLRELGYSVLAADSPARALSLCRQEQGPIDLLMTDVVMPGMNGKELMQQVVAIRPGIGVLYMSGYTADVIARHGVLDKGIHFVQKPFTLHDLARKVPEAMAGPESACGS